MLRLDRWSEHSMQKGQTAQIANSRIPAYPDFTSTPVVSHPSSRSGKVWNISGKHTYYSSSSIGIHTCPKLSNNHPTRTPPGNQTQWKISHENSWFHHEKASIYNEQFPTHFISFFPINPPFRRGVPVAMVEQIIHATMRLEKWLIVIFRWK